MVMLVLCMKVLCSSDEIDVMVSVTVLRLLMMDSEVVLLRAGSSLLKSIRLRYAHTMRVRERCQIYDEFLVKMITINVSMSSCV
jgi:hypothetical protein